MSRLLAASLALSLGGCASTIDVELVVRSERDAPATLTLERHDAAGASELLFLGRLLPRGKNTARFVAERGGRLVLFADQREVAARPIPRDAPDPFALELRVD